MICLLLWGLLAWHDKAEEDRMLVAIFGMIEFIVEAMLIVEVIDRLI